MPTPLWKSYLQNVGAQSARELWSILVSEGMIVPSAGVKWRIELNLFHISIHELKLRTSYAYKCTKNFWSFEAADTGKLTTFCNDTNFFKKEQKQYTNRYTLFETLKGGPTASLKKGGPRQTSVSPIIHPCVWFYSIQAPNVCLKVGTCFTRFDLGPWKIPDLPTVRKVWRFLTQCKTSRL